MSRKWTLKYGLAAVFVATTIIVVALFANPIMLDQTSAAASFLVMLTDPPTVPAGTAILDLTYSNVSLHVTYPNGTANWLPVDASGTVNLFSLVNMSQTIASTTIPSGSAVDKIQFTIADVDAVVYGAMYNVTALSDTLVVSVKNSEVNQTLSGVLIDFNPTLVQIQATDANGTLVYYYVLVPSATATIIGDLSKEQIKVGTIVQLGENNKAKLVHVVEEFSKNVTITSASLSVNGNVTTLSVTLKNEGNVAFRIFGLTLHGEFNATRTWEKEEDDDMDDKIVEKIHPETIPFKVNGSSLFPVFGDQEDHEHGREHEDRELSSLALQPGQSVTLSFTDVITLRPEKADAKHPAMVVTPIVGGNYTVRLMGEGFQTFNVTATS
jgi:hypothetical protein